VQVFEVGAVDQRLHERHLTSCASASQTSGQS
jgi:hypothetical protein